MTNTTFARTLALACVLLIFVGALAAPVTALTETPDDGDDDDDDDGDTIINIDLDEVVEAIEDLIDELREFTGSWDATLKDVLIAVLFAPFRTLAQQLLNAVAVVLTNTPTVYPNPAVEEIHRQTLIVTYLLSSLAFMAAGVLYMVGPLLGVSYGQVRRILPRIVIALVFASVSLPLLQLAVDLSDALVLAFSFDRLTMTFKELAGLGTGLVIVWVTESILLLALVALFIIRDVYILFVAAISPLLALAWSLPKVKRYADTFIAGWFAALAIGPLDLLVLRFALALLHGSGSSGVQSLSNWMLGVASFVLLLIVPYQVWGASQAAVGQAYAAAGTIKRRVRSNRRDLDRREGNERRRTRRSRRGPDPSRIGGSSFGRTGGGD